MRILDLAVPSGMCSCRETSAAVMSNAPASTTERTRIGERLFRADRISARLPRFRSDPLDHKIPASDSQKHPKDQSVLVASFAPSPQRRYERSLSSRRQVSLAQGRTSLRFSMPVRMQPVRHPQLSQNHLRSERLSRRVDARSAARTPAHIPGLRHRIRPGGICLHATLRACAVVFHERPL